MNAPVKLPKKMFATTEKGDRLDTTAMLEGIGDALEEVRSALQARIDTLGQQHKKRATDIYEEIALLKSSLADIAADRTAAVREVVTLRREIASLRSELDSLRRRS